MDKMQRDVLKFHREVHGLPDRHSPALRNTTFRAKLIAEEALETLEAMTGVSWTVEPTHRVDRRDFDRGWDMEHVEGDPDQSIIQTLDGICDLIYVTLGAALEFGIDLEPFWDEVQRSNMEKKGGPVRESDGKKLKPEGWTPPDLEETLRLVLDAGISPAKVATS
jgi:predicted HAD superfamily Cof-like phosphohydrolase